MKSEDIEKMRKRFQKEWLLIAVDVMDEATTTPLRGRLLAHSSQWDEILHKEMKYRGHTLTVYSEDKLPRGYAAAFHAKTKIIT